MLHVRWQAPTQFEDNATDLDPAVDLWGYKIWHVAAEDPTKRIEILATADRNERSCQVYVSGPGEYEIAMVTVAHEDSELSASYSYTAVERN